MAKYRFGQWVILSACSLSLVACGADGGEVTAGSPAANDSRGADAVAAGDEHVHATAACPVGMLANDATSLAFDGEGGYVAMGDATGLALAQFTLEAWVRRDGFGVPHVSGDGEGEGKGAPSLVPIAGRGGGNYVLGFAEDGELAADFVSEVGVHATVLGKTEISLGQWHHLAASYDGAIWRLFVDGKLDAEWVANATPRTDGAPTFSIGSLLDANGAAGFLKGSIDEVRLWDHARSPSEIVASMFRRERRGTGLVRRWAFDETDRGTMAPGAALVQGGAVLDKGLPPTLHGAPSSVNGGKVTLDMKVDDPDSSVFTSSFYLREVSAGEDFTIVVLPDTQYYSRYPEYAKYYYDQTKWIMDNAQAYNIVGVIHNGDVVDQVNVESQWQVADKAMKTLETKSARFPEGMPYGVGAGNHDQDPFGTAGGTVKYNQYFGTSRFQGRSYFGGTYSANKTDENWVTFSGGGLDFVLVDLQYSSKAREAAVLNWTKNVFDQHPNAFGIVNSHHILNADASFSAAGKSIYDAVKTSSNVQLLTCGHISAESKRSDQYGGRTIHSMLADYQSRANGGGGYLRIWEFSPKNDELTVRTYSPTANTFETDANSQYTLKVDLSGAGNAAFKVVAKVGPADTSSVRTTVDGLAPGKNYEWYATVTDCAHTVSSPVYRFSAK